MLMMRADAQFQRCLGVARAADGFVEADRGLQPLLQAGVEVEVVAPQGLLDHQQLEGLELLQVIEVVARCTPS